MRQAVGALIDEGFATEIIVAEPKQSWRTDDERMFGAVITARGREAINLSVQTHSPALAKAQSKKMLLINISSRSGGASITELTEATDWLPHTTRAAINGLRKAGYAVGTSEVDGVTRYLGSKAE